ncbi:MAG: tetratricopeptide repeat protein [Proteobacteria bacterium]|nr:tetratricopeptide repeat protein [Pseudomonadota bacterium]
MLPAVCDTSKLPTPAPERHRLQGQELLDVEDAILHLSRKVRENVHLIDEYIDLGRLFRKKGEYQRAFLLHRNVVIRSDLRKDQQARVLGEMGYDYLLSKTRDHGESYFLQSLKINKDSLYVLEGLYQCYRQTKNYEKAADTLRTIAKNYPDRKKDLAVLLSEIALQKLNAHQISSAKKFLDQAFDCDSNCSLAYLTKAKILSSDNKRKEAIDILEEFIEKWPQSTLFALKKIENLYYEMNQYSKYSYSLNKCIQKNPQNFYAHHALGKYLIKIRKNDEAIQEFQRALEICPFSIQSLKEIINLHSQKQDISLVVGAIDGFLNSFPNQQGYACPRCHEGFSDLSVDCPICTEPNRLNYDFTTAGV